MNQYSNYKVGRQLIITGHSKRGSFLNGKITRVRQKGTDPSTTIYDVLTTTGEHTTITDQQMSLYVHSGLVIL